MAIPGEYFFEAPASAYDIGIIDAVPKPTNEKPIIAVQNVGKIMAREIPDTIKTALMIYVFGIPNLTIIISDKNLDVAINVIKIRYP